MTAKANKKWVQADDAKLAELFRKGKKGGIDHTKLTNKDIHAVIEKYYRDRPYKSFAQLFRRKARKWAVEQSLQGKRSK